MQNWFSLFINVFNQPCALHKLVFNIYQCFYTHIFKFPCTHTSFNIYQCIYTNIVQQPCALCKLVSISINIIIQKYTNTVKQPCTLCKLVSTFIQTYLINPVHYAKLVFNIYTHTQVSHYTTQKN